MTTDTLTLTDNRTGLTYEVPIEDGAVRANALRQIKVDEDDFGLMSYDPAFLNTASVPERDHLHRRRRRDPPLPRLSHRAARRARARTSRPPTCSSSASCRRRTSSRGWSTRSPTTRSCTRTSRRSWTGFRYDAHPMGMFVSVVAALGDVLSRGVEGRRSRRPARSDRSG